MFGPSSSSRTFPASCLVAAVEPSCVTLTFQVLTPRGLQVLPAKYLPRAARNCPPLTRNPIDVATIETGMTVQATISKHKQEYKANDVFLTTAKVVPVNLSNAAARAGQRQPQGPPPFQLEDKNFEARDPVGKEQSSRVAVRSGPTGPAGDTVKVEEDAPFSPPIAPPQSIYHVMAKVKKVDSGRRVSVVFSDDGKAYAEDIERAVMTVSEEGGNRQVETRSVEYLAGVLSPDQEVFVDVDIYNESCRIKQIYLDSVTGKEDEMAAGVRVPYEFSNDAISDAGGPIVVDPDAEVENYFSPDPVMESPSGEFVVEEVLYLPPEEGLPSPVSYEAIETSAGASLNADAAEFRPIASDVEYHDQVETTLAEVCSCSGLVHGWENEGAEAMTERAGHNVVEDFGKKSDRVGGGHELLLSKVPSNLEAISEEEHEGVEVVDEELNPIEGSASGLTSSLAETQTLPVTQDELAGGLTNEDILKIVDSKLFEFAANYVQVKKRVARMMVDDFLYAEGPVEKFI